MKTTATVTKAYPQILSKAEGLLSITQGRCRDNAAGCVSRLILKHPERVPVADVLPALISSEVLPLKEDYQENEPVWKMIVLMCELCFSLAPSLTLTFYRPDQGRVDARSDAAAGTNHDVYAG